MFLRLPIVFLLLFQVLPNHAQVKSGIDLDSLINLNISLSEKAIYDADFEAAQKFVQLSNFNEVDHFLAKHYLALAFQSFRVQSFKNRLQNIKVDPSENLFKLQKLDSIVQRVGDKNVLGNYYSLLASSFFSTKKDTLAEQYFLLAFQLFKDTENFYNQAQVRASIISIKQTIFQREGNTKALKDLIWKYDQECEFAQIHNNKYALSFNTRHAAQIYLRQKKDYKTAEKLFNKSLDLRKEIGFKLYIPASYYSLGEVAEKMEKPDQAINMYEKSYKIADEIGFVRYQFKSRFKIAEIFENQGSLNKAREYYVDALKSASSNGYLEVIDEVLQKTEALKDN